MVSEVWAMYALRRNNPGFQIIEYCDRWYDFHVSYSN